MSIANLFSENSYDLFANSIKPNIIKDSGGNSGSSGKILSSDGSSLSWSTLSVNMNNISGMNVSSPISNQVLAYDGTNFINQTLKYQMQYNSALTIVNGTYIGQSGIISSYNAAALITNENITVSKIGARLSADPLIGSVIFTLYVNGVATALSTSIAAGSTSNSSIGTINITAGSTYAIRCTVTGLPSLSVGQVSLNYNY